MLASPKWRATAFAWAARVAVGTLAKALLHPFGIQVRAWVSEVGGIVANHDGLDAETIFTAAETSEIVELLGHALGETLAARQAA